MQHDGYRFRLHDKELKDFGLPTVKDLKNELDVELMRYDAEEELETFNRLEREMPLSEEQQVVFDYIYDVIINHKSGDGHRFIFVNAPGGTGKTTIAKRLLHKLRAEGKLGLVGAATTKAAMNYDDAYTMHSLLKFPVVEEGDRDIENPPTCQLEGTERLRLLLAILFLFWDELSSNHREIIESAVKYLRDLVFVCFGDIMQVSYVCIHMNAGDY